MVSVSSCDDSYLKCLTRGKHFQVPNSREDEHRWVSFELFVYTSLKPLIKLSVVQIYFSCNGPMISGMLLHFDIFSHSIDLFW